MAGAREVQCRIAATTATIPHPYPDRAAEDWISKHAEWFENDLAVDWAIEVTNEKILIGCISFEINKTHRRAELGYWIGIDFWNNGYCPEALAKAIEYAFHVLNLNKVTTRYMSHNIGFGRVIEKIGMEKEGLFKQDMLRNGRSTEMVVYGILNKDFNKL